MLRITLFIACIILSGCGFHLRHVHLNIATHYPVMVLPSSGSITFFQALNKALLAQSINVLQSEVPGKPFPRLMITGEERTTFPLVYGPDGELRRERLKYSVSFSFEPGAYQFTLTTQRDRQLNSKQHLGDNDEKILIEQEMQADIIGQLLRYLDTI